MKLHRHPTLCWLPCRLLLLQGLFHVLACQGTLIAQTPALNIPAISSAHEVSKLEKLYEEDPGKAVALVEQDPGLLKKLMKKNPALAGLIGRKMAGAKDQDKDASDVKKDAEKKEEKTKTSKEKGGQDSEKEEEAEDEEDEREPFLPSPIEQSFHSNLQVFVPMLPPIADIRLPDFSLSHQPLRQYGYQAFDQLLNSLFQYQGDVAVPGDYILGPGDEVVLTFWGSSEGIYESAIQANGTVTLPKVGVIDLTGVAFGQLEDVLKKEYQKYFQSVNLKATLGKMRSIRVYVIGEVKEPGPRLLTSMSNVLTALFMAGGPSKQGSLRDIRLMRGGKLYRSIDLYEFLMAGTEMGAYVQLLDGDVVVVPLIGPVVGVAGAVLRPGIYELNPAKETMDLETLARFSGGPIASADLSRVQIHTIFEGRERRILDKDLHQQTPSDIHLHPRDLVFFHKISPNLRQVITLDGYFQKPGVYQYVEGMKLLDAIKGFDHLHPRPYLRFGRIVRYLPPSKKREEIHFHLGRLLAEGASSAENIALMPNDVITVFNERDIKPQKIVQILGAVKNPGKIPLVDGMTVKDLIYHANFFLDTAYKEKAFLSRAHPSSDGLHYEELELNLNQVMEEDPQANLPLQEGDILKILELPRTGLDRKNEPPPMVYIQGAVKQEGAYPLKEKMRVKDLIYDAGNLLREAFYEEYELSRAVESDTGLHFERHYFNLQKAMDEDPEHNVLLAEFDQVFVRKKPEWNLDKTVTLNGEVRFPGTYKIAAGDRLSDLLERAGGYTHAAYLPGALLIREKIKEVEDAQLERFVQEQKMLILSEAASLQEGAEIIGTPSSGPGALVQSKLAILEQMAERVATGRIVIRLKPIDALRGTEDDILLEAGDTLTVPQTPAHIGILGAVWNPVSMLYTEGEDVLFYLNKAGGFLPSADYKNLYVLRSDGTAVPGGQVQALLPGDAIIVPSKVDAKFRLLPVVRDVSTILGQLALTAAALAAIM